MCNAVLNEETIPEMFKRLNNSVFKQINQFLAAKTVLSQV